MTGRAEETVDKRARILVIEDEARIAQFVAKGLGQDGHDVTIAADGEMGVSMASEEPFDAYVLDLGLPGMDGVEVLKWIRSRDPKTPVIVVTGRDDDRARRVCLEAGATQFFTKPLVVREFRAAVGAALAAGGSVA